MSRKNKKQQKVKRGGGAGASTHDGAVQKPFVFDQEYDVAIIGGGASGLACALACAQHATKQGVAGGSSKDTKTESASAYSSESAKIQNASACPSKNAKRQGASTVPTCPSIIVLEAGKRIGSSILRSGNGRCNFSHMPLDVSVYRNASFVEKVLANLAEQSGEAQEQNGDTQERNVQQPDQGTEAQEQNAQNLRQSGKWQEQSTPNSEQGGEAQSFVADPVLRWFDSLGLVWKEAPNSGGLLYPYSNKASSVLEVLQQGLSAFPIDVRTYTRVVSIEKQSAKEGSYTLVVEDVAPSSKGSEKSATCVIAMKSAISATQVTCADPSTNHPGRASFRAKQVVVAPGGGFGEDLFGFSKKPFTFDKPPFDIDEPVLDFGEHSPKASNACLDITPFSGVLGPLQASFPAGANPALLDGLRAQVRLSIPDRNFSEEGEVLFREYGISGIVVFNASRFARKGDALFLDFVPGCSLEKLKALFEKRMSLAGVNPQAFLLGFLDASLSEALMRVANINEVTSASEAHRLATLLKAFPLTVKGVADSKQCQVTRGGVSPDQLNSETLEVYKNPGLYVLGEAIDVDGSCGGYNLHWAWATGLLCGKALAGKITKSVGEA